MEYVLGVGVCPLWRDQARRPFFDLGYVTRTKGCFVLDLCREGKGKVEIDRAGCLLSDSSQVPYPFSVTVFV